MEAGWRNQRARVDAWEVRPYPDLEWPEVRAFLNHTATALARLVGTPNQIEPELIHLLASYLHREESPAGSQPQTADEAWSAFRQSPLKGAFIEVLDRVHAYAVMGTWLDDDLPKEPTIFVERLESDISALEAVLEAMPKVGTQALERASSLSLRLVCDIGRARLAVDELRGGAPAAGLAWLGGVSPKTILNMLSGEQLKPAGSGSVEPRSARNWLAGREWTGSCWREAIEVIANGLAAPFQEVEGGQGDAEGAAQEDRATEWVFVPRAADESLFAPELMRRNGWTVGPRGNERSFGDYWRALAFLQASSQPCWRRPNELGAFNLVTGKDWVRVARDELDLQLKAAEARRGLP